METWNPVKVGKHMHIPHDVWSCQLGRTGQLIRRINFFLQTIKSFIKDLYAVCQNCDHRRRVTAASETRGRLVGLQNTRAFLFSWDWKLTKTARKSNERMNTRFFCPRFRQNDRMVRCALDVLISCFTGNLKRKRQCSNYCCSEESIMYSSRVTRSWPVMMYWKVGRWRWSSIILHLHHVKF